MDLTCGKPVMRPIASVPQPYKPPPTYVSVGFDAFVADVRKRGILVPVVLSALGNLVDGHRRLLAAELAGNIPEIPVVTNSDIDTPAKEVAFTLASENRSERNPAAHARTLGGFMKANGIATGKALALALGISEATVSRYLALLKLEDEFLDAIGRLALTPAHAQAVSKVDDPNRKRELLRMAVADPKLSAAALKKLAFPPKRKAGSKFHTIVEGSLKVTLPTTMTFAEFALLSARIGERLKSNLKDFDKSGIKVVDLAPNT